MPKNSKVHRLYEAMVQSGVPKELAAKTAQKRTGMSLRSGKRIKKRGIDSRGIHR